MPKLPTPLKKQLGQLVKGSWETIAEQPKEIVNTALEQVGVSASKTDGQNKSVLKPEEKMDPTVITAKENQDRARGMKIVEQLNQEIEQARRDKEEKTQQELQEEQAKAEQMAIQDNQQSSLPAISSKPKRGLFGMAGRKKQVTNAIEKSQADKIGQKTSG